MRSSKKTSYLALHEWVERDDRLLLSELQKIDFEPHICRDRLFPSLNSIVTSVAFDSHSRWGIQPSKENTLKKEITFLKWMKKTNEWSHLVKLFGEMIDGPWSIPLFLTRAYQRFHIANRQETDKLTEEETIYHFTQLANQISHALVSDFEFQIQNSKNSLRKLCFQLYLEGLLPEEISQWTHFDVSQIENSISQSKSDAIHSFEIERKAS